MATRASETAPPRPRLRPTTPGTTVLYSATALLGLACAVGDERPLLVAGALYGLVVASVIAARRAPRALEVRRSAPDAVYAGEPFAVAYDVTSGEARLPLDGLSIADGLESGGRKASAGGEPVPLPRLGPGASARVEGELTAFRRGRARFGALRLAAEPAPGLARLEASVATGGEVLVLPRRGVIDARAAAPLLSRASEADLAPASRSLGEDEWRGLREYRDGDPLRRVHWKLLARWPDRPMVREMEDARVREATILLETYTPGRDARRLSRLERALSFATALAEALLESGHRVRFRAFGPGPIAVDLAPGRGGAGDLAHALALLEPSSERTVEDLLAAEEGRGAVFLLTIGEASDPAGDGAPRGLPPGALPIGPARMRELMYYAR